MKDLPVKEGKKPEFEEMRRAATAKLELNPAGPECTLADVLMEMRAHALTQKTELRVIKRLLIEALQVNKGDELEEMARKFPFTFPLDPDDVTRFEEYIGDQEKLEEVVSTLI